MAAANQLLPVTPALGAVTAALLLAAAVLAGRGLLGAEGERGGRLAGRRSRVVQWPAAGRRGGGEGSAVQEAGDRDDRQALRWQQSAGEQQRQHRQHP
ncbi:hypothetical protein, partial [Saccharothrix sp. ST-888]|uniref:hypothetical protein n=1 Tax=Saccharothrix sp. ST-888 TaxID=1427391 RepID=UPI0005EC77B3